MDYLPLFFDLRGKRCLLVGGGAIATRKARLLVKAGAVIRVVAPTVNPELHELVEQSQGEVILGEYAVEHLDACVFVISATDIAAVNQRVAGDCHVRCLPVNVVDNPALCSVITPAIVDRSPLLIGITSGGEAPVLARLVRTQLEQSLPGAYGRLAGLASKFRQRVKAAFSDGEQRRRFWERMLSGTVAEKVFAGNHEEAEALMEMALAKPDAPQGGEVYLVGAGPGDPDLLTFKALRLMQKAEVVLYDRLVSEPILDMVRRDAERIYVGKRRNQHAVEQTAINQMLVDLAKQGKRVLRLKGGDPFIFGRGGEEIDLLAENRVPFQVVPGITAASGCAAYAGIPLTHRDHAHSVRFVTGHMKDEETDLHWPDLVHAEQTLVFYMGLANIKTICERLIAHGKAADTPAALIEKGTTPEQQVHVSDLARLPDYVANREIHAPTLLIVGGVVLLHKKLKWYGEELQASSFKPQV
jgi:uroporphyrin-III C-methyltransferase/precorrin-2 dehydrogenase/sirohydrochlorin ferrochelatase